MAIRMKRPAKCEEDKKESDEEEGGVYGPRGLGSFGGGKHAYGNLISIYEASEAFSRLDQGVRTLSITPSIYNICLVAHHLHTTKQIHLTKKAEGNVQQVK